ncbi:MAG TPA: hypothetical protein VEC58_04550, partial [Roseiarcus sp.]|nr:hypothetical protein [Roseiarcus sp.]
QRFQEASGARLAEFETASGAHQAELGTALTGHAQRIDQAMTEGLEGLDGALKRRGEEIVFKIAGRLAALEETFKVQGPALDERLAQRNAEAMAQFESNLKVVEDHTDIRAKDIAKTLDHLLDRVDNGLAERSRSLNETLAQRAIEIARTMSEGGRELVSALDVKSGEIGSSLETRASTLTEALAGQAREINATLGGNLIALSGSLSESVERMQDRVITPLEAMSKALDDKLTARAQDIGSSISAALANLDDAFASHGGGLNKTLAGQIDELRAVIDGKGAEFVARIGVRGADASSELAKAGEQAAQAFDQRTTQLVSLLARRSDDLIASINAGAASSLQSLGALSGQLSSEVEASAVALRSAAEETASSASQSLTSFADQIRREIQQSGEALNQALDRSSRQTLGALTGAGDKLRNELILVVDKLGSTTTTLERSVGSASGELDAIQGKLTEQVGEFQRALGAISAQIVALTRASSTTQQETSALADRLASHANTLLGTTHDLTTTQAEVDAALERRRQSLAKLIEEVGGKSDAFEAMMHSFTATIEDSLNRAHARAREVNASLAQATSGAANAANSHFESIREAAVQERERTSAALQTSYEQANAQLSAIMNLAMERFKQSASDMRAMTLDISRELEATRQELQRGVLELPRETSEQAAAMRRVVGDQIKALNELAEIVAKAGASFDVAEPAPTLGAPRAFDGPRAAESRRGGETIVAPEPPRSRSAARPAAAPAAAAPASQPRAQAGWLSDLLLRASREEGEQGAPNGALSRANVDALDAISLDIAGLIDPDTAAEMWDRWRNGDTAAFSRRMYTPEGQQTFDEIRRRCKADAQFRETVTRYTEEFERLLAKIGRDDRDGVQ